MLPIFDFVCLESEKNALPLAAGFRLHDVALGSALLRILLYLLAKLGVFSRQQPSFWHEIVEEGEFFLHLHETKPQQVLPGQHMDPRVVAHLLKEMHS